MSAYYNGLRAAFFFPALIIFTMSSAGGSFASERPSIKKLTSKESAQKLSSVGPGDENLRIIDDLNLHSLGVGIGQTFLSGDFSDRGNDSITVDFYYNYSASYSFDFFTNFHYSKHTHGLTKARLTGLALGIKGKAYQFDAFAPYVLGGLGFYNPKVRRMVKNNVLKESESQVTFGWNIGLGADLKLNRQFTIGILWHFHNPFDVKQDLDSDVEGSYSKLLITTLYSFK